MQTLFRSVPFQLVQTFVLAFLIGGNALAQTPLSGSAYRVLGQVGFQQNSLNLAQGLELYSPSAIALDTRNGQARLFISDSNNQRIMAWSDIRSYQNGDAPSLVLGQPGPQYTSAYGIGIKGFNGPLGLAVDPTTGNLFVADFGNNRVVRFPNPFSNPTRIEPDAVYGQTGFNGTSAGISKNTLNRPRAVAVDSQGNLWVADTGNHRVMRFSAATLDNPTPPDADLVIGQRDFSSASANSGDGVVSATGLDTPAGLAFDAQDNLYVADFNNTRVLRFSGPLTPAGQLPAASGVWGQNDFHTRGIPQASTASSLAGPTGLSIDPAGNLVVSVPSDNRVLIFPLSPLTGAAAKTVLGQSDFTSTTVNAGAAPRASQNSLSNPRDVKIDPNGSILVADANNNRVLLFPPNSKAASLVWGQSDFVSNGPNQVKPGSINAAFKMVVDYSSSPYALYVSDINNNRVLVWKDSARFKNGDPADLVIGQPDFTTAIPNIDTRASQVASATSLFGPAGMAVNPADGTLYVADSGNNRVLRYPRPVSQSGRITPDAVFGQLDFTSTISAVITAASLRTPTGIALGPDGNLFVADSGNNRVLEYAAGSGTGSLAIRVYGQPGMNSSSPPTQNSAQTLTAPRGLAVDRASNLYVADYGASRALIFPNTQSAPAVGASASFVIGQSSFNATASAFRGPSDVALDSNGNIYVSDQGNNRVLVFPSLVFLPATGGSPTGVIGQRDLSGINPNWNAPNGQATAESIYAPLGIYVDRQDTLYVGDSGNNRLLHYLKAMAVVNAATYQLGAPVAPGAISTLFGSGLTDTTELTATSSWPTVLAKREVVINDQVKAALYFMNSSQVNFQIPQNAPLGFDRIAVRVAETSELIAGGSLSIAAVAPGLYTSSQDGKGQVAAINQDGKLNSSANPAARGSVITMYGTGQGQVNPSVPDGAAAPPSPLSNTATVLTSDGRTCLGSQPSMCVAIGASFGEIQFAGLAPGYVGLWQINVKVPTDIVTGIVGVRVLLNGVPSNLVSIAIR